jgi:two-component system sensor histidine kinase BarA
MDFDSKDTISFLAPVTLPEIIIEDHPAILQLQENNGIRNAIIGWVKVELEKKTTRIKEYQILIHSVLIVLLGISISILLALRMGLSVTNPILAMTKAVEEIKNGKLTTRINTKSKWELDVLKSGINTMVNSMQKSQEDLQHNVAQATADLRTTLEHIEIQNIELQSARKEAESNSKIKSEFLVSMSHELCTPLNAIMGFIDLLAKTELNTTQKDYTSVLQKSSSSLLSIINEILDFSKIETGNFKLAVKSMNLRECVEDTNST